MISSYREDRKDVLRLNCEQSPRLFELKLALINSSELARESRVTVSFDPFVRTDLTEDVLEGIRFLSLSAMELKIPFLFSPAGLSEVTSLPEFLPLLCENVLGLTSGF